MSVDVICCPICQYKKVVKRGKRRVAFGEVQLYQCRKCGKTFSQSQLGRRSYPSRIVRWVIQYYGQGYTFEEIQRLINKRFKVQVARSTIHRWVNDHKDLVPINQWRHLVRQYDPLILKQSFFHENLEYLFQLHQYKVDRLVKKLFPSLYTYLWGFESGCPDEFFQLGLRCSQPIFLVDVIIRYYQNLACHMARFAIKSRRSNRERHKLVEEFMLLCDKATVAIEVPVWYWEKSVNRGITGHIDVVQIRRNTIYIMDYKPGAVREKKAVQQLYHYATALGFRARISFKNMRCAWFDDKNYFEFRPEKATASLIR